MGAVVLDASVIIGLFDPLDALHAPAAEAARSRRAAGDQFIVPASVPAEVLLSAARKGDAELAARHALTVGAFGSPYPLDENVAVAAARWRARHQALRLPDALVLATADAAAADVVLAGDKQWAALDRRVSVIGRAAGRA